MRAYLGGPLHAYVYDHKGEIGVKRIMRRVYRTGSYCEVADILRGANARPKGATRSARGFGTSRPEQVTANDKKAIRELTALISGNFSYRDGDLWVCLTLDNDSLCDLDELTRRAGLFLRAAARKVKQKGGVLRWVLAPADLDGDTLEPVRPHCHLVMSGDLTVAELRALWRYGTVDVRTLHRKKSQKALATYIVRQARHAPNAKKWTCSRNLKRTVLVREYWVEPGQKYKLPPRAVECEREYDPEAGKQLYLAYSIGTDDGGGRKRE